MTNEHEKPYPPENQIERFVKEAIEESNEKEYKGLVDIYDDALSEAIHSAIDMTEKTSVKSRRDFYDGLLLGAKAGYLYGSSLFE